MTATPTTFRKKYTNCAGRDKPLRYPLMTIRSKQWYTKTSRLPNSFVNVSIGRPPLIRSRQHDHRSDGRWSQNFKYIWLAFRWKPPSKTGAAAHRNDYLMEAISACSLLSVTRDKIHATGFWRRSV